jgi:DnaJ family protein C protein 10
MKYHKNLFKIHNFEIYYRYKVIINFFVIISLIQGEDYYETLGINRSAGQDEIRKAFKKLAIVHHPDKNSVCKLSLNIWFLLSISDNNIIFQDDPNAHDKFIRLTTAYEVLKDNDLRRKYDLYGENGLDNSNKKQTYHSWSYYQNNFDIYEDDKYVITLEENNYCEYMIFFLQLSFFIN